MYNWLTVTTELAEDATTHVAYLRDRNIATEAGRGPDMRTSVQDYSWTVVIKAIGAATNVDVDGLVGDTWVSLAVDLVVGGTVVINAHNTIQVEAIRLTWTGSPDGAGTATCVGNRKFNGRG